MKIHETVADGLKVGTTSPLPFPAFAIGGGNGRWGRSPALKIRVVMFGAIFIREDLYIVDTVLL